MQSRPQYREYKFVVHFREVRGKNSKMLFDTGSYPVQKRSPEAGKNGEHLLFTGDYLPLSLSSSHLQFFDGKDMIMILKNGRQTSGPKIIIIIKIMRLYRFLFIRQFSNSITPRNNCW